MKGPIQKHLTAIYFPLRGSNSSHHKCTLCADPKCLGEWDCRKRAAENARPTHRYGMLRMTREQLKNRRLVLL